MEIYASKYKTTLFDEEKSVMVNNWTAEEMDAEIFQKEILAWAELVEKYKPKGMVANTKLFGYTVSIDQQEWTNNVIFPRLIAAGMKRFAVIVNNDIMTQLSLEQTMETENSAAFQSCFFDNEAQAIKWATVK